MRAAACLHAGYAVRRQNALADQKLGVFACVNVVGHHGKIDFGPECAAQDVHQGRLAASDRTGHANAKRALLRCL
jgi:hypothetical protein